ncbi:DUF413 domain-containing protein [Prolixibacter denitrificans]|uniref:Macrodomain Ori protein n=1 Tax=Prolixibacter denitrificans TaxID=1541063 RepID=A0A2P8C6B6_9BACT|nr:DUF413 domain-containing protein [Prolixibacter denitrificans]PSK80512.1 uncharacterized protein DUF413 [Prolixibacter denitrificans]GET22713.1 hypothetical protein JCM18694_29590 [Prolixibacter denitrificans]
MTDRRIHNDYISQKGPFVVDCNHAIFTEEELKILERWGHWFQALTDGELAPLTKRQELFVEVANGKRDPVSVEEQAWFKYLGRKRIEQKMGDRLKVSYEYQDDGFYSRADAKELRKMMYGVNSRVHRQ